MKLFEYTEQYKKALIELDDMDLPNEVVNDTLEALQGELAEKGKNVGAYIRNLEADTNAIKEAENAMAKRRLAIQKRIDWMKDYLLYNMQHSGITEISCPHYVIKVKKNPPAVWITNENVLPEKYSTEITTTKIDKKLIKDDINSGETIPGAELHNAWRLDIK